MYGSLATRTRIASELQGSAVMPLSSASMVIVDLEGMLTYRNRRQPLLPLKEAAKNTGSLLGTSAKAAGFPRVSLSVEDLSRTSRRC